MTWRLVFTARANPPSIRSDSGSATTGSSSTSQARTWSSYASGTEVRSTGRPKCRLLKIQDYRPDPEGVVWRDEEPPAFRSAAVRRAIGHQPLPLDIAVVTPSEFEQFRMRPAHIVGIASREGVIVHAA